jgi:uncharacterized cysteine cluster protein YcgN (CxxCxxCC family)
MSPMTPGQIRKHLHVLREAEGDLEKLCVHCSACCYAHVTANQIPMVIKSLRCKFLAVEGDGKSHCTVYAERREKAPWCKNLDEAIAQEIFPQACPYVDTFTGYVGPRELAQPDYRAVLDQLRRDWRDGPRKDWADPAEWQAFMDGGDR